MSSFYKNYIQEPYQVFINSEWWAKIIVLLIIASPFYSVFISDSNSSDFRKGDYVRVFQGEYKGRTGVVKDIRDRGVVVCITKNVLDDCPTIKSKNILDID